MENSMIGKSIGRYQILEKLGEGGMGIVYKAHDTSLNRPVALKFLPLNLTKDETTRKRFKVEAQAASALDHPNICNIHEINETDDGQLYICMAYYQGESLRERIKNGPIPLEDTLNIFVQLAQGLGIAHERDIIHRDIKPGNIIITEKGEVKIVDFGLAKLAGIDLTKSTSSKGTAAYMSPEQVRGEKVDHRSDIWALGIVLYEMLTSHLPFVGDYPEPMMFSIVNVKPRPLSEYISDFPVLLQTIIDRLLKKDPEERYQNISELLADLKPLIKEKSIVVIKHKPSILKSISRKKTYLYAGIVLIATLILILIMTNLYLSPDTDRSKRLAVLPFKTIANDSTQEMFASGMAEVLRTKIAELGDLNVIESASSMAYKDTEKTPVEIAAELNVQYLVDGVTINIDDSISQSVRLINVENNEYLWAKEYKVEFKKILGIFGEITKTIASKVEIRLAPQLETRLTETRQVNPESFEMYIKGMSELNRGTEIGIIKGVEYLTQAVKIDSTEPYALAGLSLGYSIIAHGSESAPEAVKLSKEAAQKALALDDNLAEAHLASAMIKIYKENDIKGAGDSYRRALEIKPNYALALMHYGYYVLHIEGVEKAISLIQKAMELEPISHIYPAELSEIYFINVIGKNDQTIELANKALDLEPDYPKALYVLGAGYAGKGMYEQAIEVQKKAVQLNPALEYTLAYTYAKAGMTDKALEIAAKLENRNDVWDTWCLAVIYSALKNDEMVFYWLEQAYTRRHPVLQWLHRQICFFSQYENDSRFRDLLSRLHTPDKSL
jgi:serine/threonine protein kinase/tetratricopeptide (TPR) repeat protein